MIITAKDLRLALARGGGLVQALLLGLLLLFVFSIARAGGAPASPREAAAFFWLSSVFCQILIFNQLYALEERNETRLGLLLSPYPAQGIWLGKALAAFVLLLLAQAFFLPATIVFLNQTPQGGLGPALAGLILVDAGICGLGSLLGAMTQGQGGRDALLSVIFFPLLIPLLLAAINIGAVFLGSGQEDLTSWLSIAAAFDAVFSGAGLLLFGFLFRGDA